MRPGQAVSLDFITGIAIFLAAFTAGVFLLQDALAADEGFDAQVTAAGQDAHGNLRDAVDWTVTTRPVLVYSDAAAENVPVVTDIPVPFRADPDIVVSRRGAETPSQFDRGSNTTAFVGDLARGVTRFDAAYTRDGVPPRDYGRIDGDSDQVWTEDINITLDSSGFTRFHFRDLAMLDDTADLDLADSPTVDRDAVRANISYDGADPTQVEVFDGSRWVLVRQHGSGTQDWTLNLTGNFTELYEGGSTTDISGTGIFLEETTDQVDLSSVRGLTIAGEDLFVNVSKRDSDGPVTVKISFDPPGEGFPILLLPHDGDHTATLAAVEAFFSRRTRVGPSIDTTGVSDRRAEAFAAQDTDMLRERLDLGQLGFNVTIPGVLSIGEPISQDTTVSVVSFPVPVVHRFGNASTEPMQLRVWNR